MDGVLHSQCIGDTHVLHVTPAQIIREAAKVYGVSHSLSISSLQII